MGGGEGRDIDSLNLPWADAATLIIVKLTGWPTQKTLSLNCSRTYVAMSSVLMAD